MLIQELIDKLEDIKKKVGNIEILTEEYDGRTILPDNYREFNCTFTFHEDCNMFRSAGLKYNRKMDNEKSWYPIRTDAVIFHCCSEEYYKIHTQDTKELLESRGCKYKEDKIL